MVVLDMTTAKFNEIIRTGTDTSVCIDYPLLKGYTDGSFHDVLLSLWHGNAVTLLLLPESHKRKKSQGLPYRKNKPRQKTG